MDRGRKRLKTETDVARMDAATREVAQLGDAALLTCPECAGPILEVVDAGLVVRYRCQVGHAYSGESMLAGRLESVERGLWNLVSAFEEAGRVARVLADRARKARLKAEAAAYADLAKRSRAEAQAILKIIRRAV